MPPTEPTTIGSRFAIYQEYHGTKRGQGNAQAARARRSDLVSRPKQNENEMNSGLASEGDREFANVGIHKDGISEEQ